MRKPKKLDPLFDTAFVSDFNGPVTIDTKFREYGDGLKVPFKYKVAKPYKRLDFNVPDPVHSRINKANGDAYEFVSMPFDELMIEHISVSNNLFKRFDLGELVDIAPVINSAITKSQVYGELLMIVSLTEAKQTALMIRNVFISLFNAIMALYRQAKRLNVVATIEVLSDLWLEYRYGWRPLIGEVKSLHKVLTVHNPNGIKSAYAPHKVDVSKVNLERQLDNVIVRNTDGSVVEYSLKLHDVSEATVKVGYNYLNTQDSRNESWLAILGFDVQSLLSTAWEMIPFSFVVDFFLNIGDMLQARDFESQVSHFNGYKTSRIQADLTVKPVTISLPPDWPTLPIDTAGDFHWVYPYRRQDAIRRRTAGYSNDREPWIDLHQDPTGAIPLLPVYWQVMRDCSSLEDAPGHMIGAYDESGNLAIEQGKEIFSVLYDEITRDTILAKVAEYDTLWNEWYGMIADGHNEATRAFKDNLDRSLYAYKLMSRIIETESSSDKIIFFQCKAPVSEILDVSSKFLQQTTTFKLLERVLFDEFNHTATATAELNSGQYADLGALAVSLTKGLRK